MTKEAMQETILAAKKSKKATWDDLAKATGLNPSCVAAACYGSASLTTEEAAGLAGALSLGKEIEVALMEYPLKGKGQVTPSDPLIYRFFEIAYVYGPALKDVIHEKFGDGIMSAIDFSVNVEKEEDPKGDRVKITMNGKFLPYKKW